MYFRPSSVYSVISGIFRKHSVSFPPFFTLPTWDAKGKITVITEMEQKGMLMHEINYKNGDLSECRYIADERMVFVGEYSRLIMTKISDVISFRG